MRIRQGHRGVRPSPGFGGAADRFLVDWTGDDGIGWSVSCNTLLSAHAFITELLIRDSISLQNWDKRGTVLRRACGHFECCGVRLRGGELLVLSDVGMKCTYCKWRVDIPGSVRVGATEGAAFFDGLLVLV